MVWGSLFMRTMPATTVSLMNREFYKQNLYKEVSGKQINQHLCGKTNDKIFYKCVAKDLTHHGFTYKIGLNEDIVKFDPSSECKGGLYFTDKNHISDYLDYGTNFANVKIPNDAKCYLEDNKMKCDKIILELICQISKHNLMKNVDFCLKVVKQNGNLIQHIDDEILKNNINICLEAVKQEGYSIRYINDEILKKNINICLEAVKHDGHAVRYIDDEILKNNVDVCLEAVKQNGYSIRYIDGEILKKNVNIRIESLKQIWRF